MDKINISDKKQLKKDGGEAIRAKYKDSAFCITYGTQETAALLVSDLLGKNYDATDIQIVTLDENGVNGRHNDLGVIVENMTLFFGEEQSTDCPNMPIRFLLYLAKTYEKYIKEKQEARNLYGSKIIKLPVPVFYVISTVKTKTNSYRLSDAFTKYQNLMIDLEVKIIYNHSYEACNALKPYYRFVEFIERNKHRKDTDQVRREAIEAVKNGGGSEIVINRICERSEEIMGGLAYEFTIEEARELGREEGREEAIEVGIKSLIKFCKEIGKSKYDILERVEQDYNLSNDKAEEIISKYWD